MNCNWSCQEASSFRAWNSTQMPLAKTWQVNMAGQHGENMVYRSKMVKAHSRFLMSCGTQVEEGNLVIPGIGHNGPAMARAFQDSAMSTANDSS